MTGLEKMIDQIKSESDQAALAVVAKAQAEAARILESAGKQAQSECEKIEHASTVRTADLAARSKSAADLQKRRLILAEKQRLIGETIEEAKQSLYTLKDAEYFGVIVKMAVKLSLPQAGVILFSSKDLARLPKGFEGTLNAAISEKGAELTISDQTRPMDGGFILIYGGVEENCSFTALFDAAHESLQDKVQELLFI